MNTRLVAHGVFSIISALFLVANLHDKSEAAVLNFDDISKNDFSPISNNYGELSWSNFYVQNSFRVSGSGYDKGAISKPYVAFNGNGAAASIKSNTKFDFNSAYLTSVWNDNLNLTVEGLFNGVKKYSQIFILNTKSPIFFNADYLGINELTFSSFGGTNASLGGRGTHFALDDFSYNITQVTSPKKSVPEEISLIGIATFGLIGIRMNRKKC
jgi:hypothetical protein